MELGNKDVLETIEKSLFVVVLDDELPTDDSDCCWKLMCGNPSNRYGTIHLRRQHVLGGEGCPHVPMVKRLQYIRIKNPLHKHFAGMPMVGG